MPHAGSFLHRGLEFAEEADVVLEVEAEVLDLPFEHGDALHAHSEGETGVLLGVDAAGFQDVGIHHTGTHDLQPTGALADVAALAAADVAADVHFGAGLGKGEVGGAHTDPNISRTKIRMVCLRSANDTFLST